MKRTRKRPLLSDLCVSARGALDDHRLEVKVEDQAEIARRRKFEEIFIEIKRQLENLADPIGTTPATPPASTKR